MIEGLPDTSARAIGERIARVREARGMTQSAMARLLDMSPQRYGGYERGRTLPPPNVLARFWQITGATSDYILFERFDGLPYELARALQAAATEAARRAAPPAPGA